MTNERTGGQMTWYALQIVKDCMLELSRAERRCDARAVDHWTARLEQAQREYAEKREKSA